MTLLRAGRGTFGMALTRWTAWILLGVVGGLSVSVNSRVGMWCPVSRQTACDVGLIVTVLVLCGLLG